MLLGIVYNVERLRAFKKLDIDAVSAQCGKIN